MIKNKVVEISGLSKKYKKANKFAISDISIDCYEGEIVGLLGRNGAGKSTTIKCLTGFFPFEQGNVKICNYDIKKNPIDKSNGGIGIVPYVYQQAYRYYYSLWEAQQKNENKVIKEYVPKVKEIVIPVPQRKAKKRKMFSFLDEEIENGK